MISRLMRITRHTLDKAFNFFSLARLLPPQERRINKKSRLDFSTHEYHIARNGLCTLQTASTPFSKLNYLSPPTVSPISFSLSLLLSPFALFFIVQFVLANVFHIIILNTTVSLRRVKSSGRANFCPWTVNFASELSLMILFVCCSVTAMAFR